MNVVLWTIASVLALAFLAAGLMKLLQPKAALTESGLEVLGGFSPGAIKAIGALEVLAAVGLVVPAVVDVAPVLVPLAALGLVALMAGAAFAHGRRGEHQALAANAALLVLAAVVAGGRLGPLAF